MKNNIIKNIPNILTMSRIIFSVLSSYLFIKGNILLAIFFYVYGSVSDLLDGFLARKLNASSEFGRKLDAISDKIYAASLLIPSIFYGNWLMIITFILELKIVLINLKSERLGFKTTTQEIGKYKTALLFPTMIVGLLTSIAIEFYFFLCLLLPITTLLQIQSIIVYKKLLKHNVDSKRKDE